MQISLFLLFRIAAGVLIGIWLVGKVRNPLRAMVVRTMPMKYRISEKSFVHQTRITTLVSALFALLIAAGIFMGLTRLRDLATKKRGDDKTIQQDNSEASSFGVPLPPPEVTPAVTEAPIPEAAPAPAPEARPVIAPPKPKPAALVIDENSYFIQHSAYEEADNAWAQQAKLDKRLVKGVWVGFAPEDEAPYKVLVGPFADGESANAYKRKKKLSGYARPLEDIRLFAR